MSDDYEIVPIRTGPSLGWYARRWEDLVVVDGAFANKHWNNYSRVTSLFYLTSDCPWKTGYDSMAVFDSREDVEVAIAKGLLTDWQGCEEAECPRAR